MGQSVVRAGNDSDSFFVVDSGRANLLAQRSGEEIVLGTLTRGNPLGEQRLVRSAKREFTVRAFVVLLRLWKKKCPGATERAGA